MVVLLRLRILLTGATILAVALVFVHLGANAGRAAPTTPVAALEHPNAAKMGNAVRSSEPGDRDVTRGGATSAPTSLEPQGAEAATLTAIVHKVLPAESLQDICERYGVTEEAVIARNGLDPTHPRLRAGSTLDVLARQVPPPRKRVEHIVRFGDNWRSLAARYQVSERQLHAWNREVPRRFAAGDVLIVWTEGSLSSAELSGLGLDRSTDGLSLPEVEDGGESRGSPDRGRLLHGVQLPENEDLYTVRRPDFAYGSSHMVENLQLALAKFRTQSDFPHELIISDMSRPRGGRYGHHDSHQSGRDVDIWLPRTDDVEPGKPPASASQIDWPATWSLVKALIRTGEVQYIFLTRTRQRLLYKAAQADGFDKVALGDILQYPRRAQTAIVRHASGHTKHMHVRFRCAPSERYCR